MRGRCLRPRLGLSFFFRCSEVVSPDVRASSGLRKKTKTNESEVVLVILKSIHTGINELLKIKGLTEPFVARVVPVI